MMLKSINPYTNRIIGEYEEYPQKKLEEILNNSSSAFTKWKRTGFSYRRSLMNKVADILNNNITDLSLVITLEMGKPVRESRAEIEKCAWVCRYYAANAEEFLKDENVEADTYQSYVSYEPMGTILGIMPWNYPFWQVFRFAVPTLMAGNTVVLKHSSNVQNCARNIEEIFTKAGFPLFVFSNVVISSSGVEMIIEHDAIKAVSLTGSESAGEKVAGAAGRNIKKSLLELGGSNAFIVLDDADLENAAETAVKARMMNAGQSCISAKRFIVQGNISDKFIGLFRDKINKLTIGDPSKEETDIGPLATVKQAEQVEYQVQASIKMGAKLILGGKRNSAFYPPALLVDVKPGMPVFDEEVFGPVAPVIVARNAAEAVALASQTKFGLGVSIFTNDLVKARDLAGEFKDGAVFVNELVKSDPRLPFGGTGKSGYGRELSIHGIMEFVNVKTIYIKKV